MSFRPFRAAALLAVLLAAAAGAQDAPPATGDSAALSLEDDLLARAQAQFDVGDIAGGIASRMALDAVLSGPPQGANREALWRTLSALPPGTDFSRVTEPVARGWVELMLLARNGASLAAFENWRQRHPGHPGESQIAAVLAMPASRTEGPIAVLLPLEGPLAPAAKAILAGAQAAQARAGHPAPTLSVHDTSQGLEAALLAASAEGAVAAIGPLRKEDVTALAGQVPALPLVTLNYLDQGRTAPPGLTAFGLAPEDEARAAAEDAFARGLSRALTMVPATDWGNRVQVAFAARFRELGGTVVESGRYSGEPQAWSDPVKRLLRYVAINDKKAAAEARAKAGPDVDPQRRNDFDFVFLAGRASQARVLWPLFRYYHADRTPVYATSAVNESVGDGDLAGIRFCDAPWLVESGGQRQAVRDEALNGRSREAARFFAFGVDAQALAGRIARNQLHGGELVAGVTGALGVDTSGAVRRKLACAQMTNGGDPALLPPPDVSRVPITP